VSAHDKNAAPLPEDAVDVLPRKRGFAALTPEQLREISSMGGRAAHAAGVAHEFTSEEGKRAGRLGGLKVAAKRRAVKP
jgi:uncharacterized protein